MRFLLIIALLGPILVACSPSTVGGYPVGERRCGEAAPGGQEERDQCDRFTGFARATLDQQAPGHAAVVGTEVYRDPPGVLYSFGGYGDVAVVALRLADDTVRAFHVQCGVGVSKEMCLSFVGPPAS